MSYLGNPSTMEQQQDWSTLPAEIWLRIIQYLNEPKEWVNLRATSTRMGSLAYEFGYGQIKGLDITASSAYGPRPRCELRLYIGNKSYPFGYTLYRTLRVLQFLWPIAHKLTGVAIKSPLFKGVYKPFPFQVNKTEHLKEGLVTPFMMILRTLEECNKLNPRKIQSFIYAPVTTPTPYSKQDLQMIRTLLLLLTQWKPTLKHLRILDQGHHVDKWVEAITPDNVLETLHTRTLPFKITNSIIVPGYLNVDFGLGALTSLTVSPKSKITYLALFMNYDDYPNDMPHVERGQIIRFLRSLTPQAKFTLVFPNSMGRTSNVLCQLASYPDPSPWQLELKVLDLGSDSTHAYIRPDFIWNAFPNLHTCIGIPFRVQALMSANSLKYWAVDQPQRHIDVRFKCQPTHRKDKDYLQVRNTLFGSLPKKMRFPEDHSTGDNDLFFEIHAKQFEGLAFQLKVDSSRKNCKLVKITVTYKAHTHQRLVFSVPLYSQQSIKRWKDNIYTLYPKILPYY
jgi:hypothetical protein